MEITEATTINLGLLLTIGGVTIGVLIGFVKWLTTMYNLSKENKGRIHQVEKDMAATKSEVAEMRKEMSQIHASNGERLARIEEAVKGTNDNIKLIVKAVIEKLDRIK